MEDLIKKTVEQIKENIRTRFINKVYLDAILKDLSVANTGTRVNLVESGSVVDPFGLRYYIEPEALKIAAERLISNGDILVNIDHNKESILTDAIGYVDAKTIEISKGTGTNGNDVITGIVYLNTESPAVIKLAQDQELGLTRGVSIEMGDIFEYTIKDIQELGYSVMYINDFNITGLAIVKEGASISSNNIKFNLQIMENIDNENLNKQIDEATKVADIEAEKPVEAEAITSTPENSLEEVTAKVEEVVTTNKDLQAKLSEQVELNKLLEVQLKETQKSNDTVKDSMQKLMSTLEINDANVNKNLAPSPVTPYTGTQSRGVVTEATMPAKSTDAVIADLLRNDTMEYRLQPLNPGGSVFTPVVRTIDSMGWDMGAFDPATECCYTVNPTSEAAENIYEAGFVCSRVNVDQFETLFENGGNGALVTSEINGLTPAQFKVKKAIEVLEQRLNYGLLRGSATLPAGVVPTMDGLVGVYSLSPFTVSASGSNLVALDTAIATMRANFPSKVGLNGEGLVAYMNGITAQAIAVEARDRVTAMVMFTSMNEAESALQPAGTITRYRGVRIVTGDIAVDTVTGTSNIYVATEGNVAAKKLYITKSANGFGYSQNLSAISPISLSTSQSAMPNCVLSEITAYYGLGVAYAKSSFELLNINNVNVAPYGLSMLNGMRDQLNVHLGNKFTGQ